MGVIVKRLSLAAMATLAILSASACQDAVTSPQLTDIRNGRSSNPPPPPVEETAAGSFISTATLLAPSASPQFSGFQPRFSIQQSAGLGSPRFDVSTSTFCPFTIPVRFFYNPNDGNGYVHFESSDNGVIASSNGMVKKHGDDFSGKGSLEILVEGCGLIVIDLASVNDANSSFCGFDQNCFNLYFDDALLYPCGDTSCSPIDGTANMSGGDFED
jgi:hypothetical protein